jgi:hypothetical protein
MSGRSTDPGRRCLPICEWPRYDQAAWQRALQAGRGPFRDDGGGRRLSSASLRKFEGGYGRWLGFLAYCGQLDPDGLPQERPTVDWLDRYFHHLRACGNADYTIVGRFAELRAALQLMGRGRKLMMQPDDYSWITRPHGRSLRDVLPMKRRDVFIPGSEELQAWAEELFLAALALTGNMRRCVRVRDAVLIGLLAERAPRLRTIFELHIGINLQRHGDGWLVRLSDSNMKMGKAHWYPLSDVIAPMLERYAAVERQELLGGKTHDALWVNWDGNILGKRGVEKRSAGGRRSGLAKPSGLNDFVPASIRLQQSMVSKHPSTDQ